MMGSEGGAGAGAACAACGGVAAVYCAADAAALCVPCDVAVHTANPLASRHERVPLAVAMAAASSGVYDLFAADDDASSCWQAAPAAPHGQAAGLGSPNDSSSSFANDGAGAERSFFDLLSDVDIMVCGGAGLDGLSPPHGASPLWLEPAQLATTAAALTSWSQAESVVVPTTTAAGAAAAAAAAAERQARVMRYREKRKNRRFQKTIRYASRKAYAEARPRIKGRFVKRAAAAAASSDDESCTADGATAARGAADGAGAETAKFWLSFSDDGRADGAVGFYMDAAGYGVVPTF